MSRPLQIMVNRIGKLIQCIQRMGRECLAASSIEASVRANGSLGNDSAARDSLATDWVASGSLDGRAGISFASEISVRSGRLGSICSSSILYLRKIKDILTTRGRVGS